MVDFTLIDVMTGMDALSLNTVMTPPCFKFFWGLVMRANKLKPRFKNPFDLTVEQGIGVGGGKSRQSLNQMQHALNKVMVDGERLIWIKPGSKTKNTAAKYKINWILILSASPTVSESTETPSIKLDEVMTEPFRSCYDSLDDPMSILRSEKRREEKNTPAENNISRAIEGVVEKAKQGSGVLSQKDEEREKSRDQSKQVEYLQDMIMDAFSPQLTQKPAYPACRSALDTYGFDILEAATIEAKGKALNNPTPAGALNYVVGIARNGQSGLSFPQRSKIAGKLKELKLDLLAAEKESEDSDKFNDVFVAGEIVSDKQEFCDAVKSEIERLKQIGG